MYAMGFIFNDGLMEVKFVAKAISMGYTVEKLDGRAYSITGIDREQRDFIMKWADKYWAF